VTHHRRAAHPPPAEACTSRARFPAVSEGRRGSCLARPPFSSTAARPATGPDHAEQRKPEWRHHHFATTSRRKLYNDLESVSPASPQEKRLWMTLDRSASRVLPISNPAPWDLARPASGRRFRLASALSKLWQGCDCFFGVWWPAPRISPRPPFPRAAPRAEARAGNSAGSKSRRQVQPTVTPDRTRSTLGVGGFRFNASRMISAIQSGFTW
jgi:hypothetical protein